MNQNEVEIEKWIARSQEGHDALCNQMREIVRSNLNHSAALQKIIVILAIEQLRSAHNNARLLGAMGFKVPPVLD